ncbi:MAG TPA: GMC oxidoreductase [Desulfobacterales bacterium]
MAGDENTFDFVVIGSGFGGSVSALRLAEKGYSVAVLEAGRRYRDEDFPRTNWNLPRSLWLPLLRCYGMLRIRLLSDVLILHYSGVGGGSLGYAGTLLEPPDAFYRSGSWAKMQDWKSALSPHFRTARRMLGVDRVPEASAADEILLRVAAELDCRQSFRLQDVGVFFGEPEKTVADPYFEGRGPARSGCRFCGGCMVGCRYNAKNTLVKNYLYLAEQLGVQIFAETRASLIRMGPAGGYDVETTRSTAWLSTGRQRTFHARRLVLAAGVLGTLTLLMRCREKGTLPNLSPQLGCRVRTNSESLTGATAKNHRVDYSRGVAITSSIFVDAVTHIEPVRFPAGSDLLGLLATRLTDPGPVMIRSLKWAAGLLRHPVQSLRLMWPFGWARRTIILLVMQTLDNSLRVRRRRRWFWPFKPLLVSETEPGREKVPVCIPQAQDATRILADKIDGFPRNTLNEVLLNMGTTAHILGGCAIGPDPEQGVIDLRNEAYGHRGLYIVDGSAIPANPGVNPSLTITALAEHAMSRIPPKRKE